MIDWSTIETAIAAWAVTYSTLSAENVLWLGQDVPVTERPQVRLGWLVQDLIVGSPVRDERQRSAVNGTEAVIHRRRHVLTVTWHAELPSTAGTAGRAALAAIGVLSRSLQLETVKASLRAAGLSIARVGNPQDLSDFLESRFETRAQFEIEIYTVDTTSDVVGAIATVTDPVGTVTFGGS